MVAVKNFLKRWISSKEWGVRAPGRAIFILLLGSVVCLQHDSLLFYYHKAQYEAELSVWAELSTGRYQTKTSEFIEKIRHFLGLESGEGWDRLEYHQSCLIDEGYLVRRDLQLNHTFYRPVFTTNVMMQIGGPHSWVGFEGARKLAVVAQPSHIEAFTRWILEQDAKIPPGQETLPGGQRSRFRPRPQTAD